MAKPRPKPPALDGWELRDDEDGDDIEIIRNAERNDGDSGPWGWEPIASNVTPRYVNLLLSVPEMVEALKFCRSVLAANPTELSEKTAIKKVDAVLRKAMKARRDPWSD